MKLIIDINDNEYIGIKEYPNNITSYPVIIHLYEAVRNGIPLDKIRAEIIDTGAYEQEVNGKTEFLKGINYCLSIIDKYSEK